MVSSSLIFLSRLTGNSCLHFNRQNLLVFKMKFPNQSNSNSKGRQVAHDVDSEDENDNISATPARFDNSDQVGEDTAQTYATTALSFQSPSRRTPLPPRPFLPIIQAFLHAFTA